jgi:pimeloyl-ACP methyl ester carboxylesterase
MKAGRFLLLISLALTWSGKSEGTPSPPGYHAKITVGAATRIDWTFALANRSLVNPPANWLGNYDSKQQQYELFVPPADAKKPLPVIVFISPDNEPMGWKHFQDICKQQGILFAGPWGAGNKCPPKKRVRIVLDVLDDIRRNYPTDPDRTSLAGFSGGGRIACGIAFALPEYFGGVMPICVSGDLRDESWLRQRAIDRLSVALLTGEKDFNRGEVDRLRGPMLKEVGMTARVWVQRGIGHAIPSEKILSEAIRWLDEGAPRRREEAKRHPASRMAGDAVPSHEEQARALFAEAQKRLDKRETLYSGLMQLKGCMVRWPDLKEGVQAREILQEYDSRAERPWEVDDLAEQRRFLIAQARALDAYVSGDLPPEYAKERPAMARQAVRLWRKVLADGPETAPGKQAKKRIPALEKIVAADKSPPP